MANNNSNSTLEERIRHRRVMGYAGAEAKTTKLLDKLRKAKKEADEAAARLKKARKAGPGKRNPKYGTVGTG